ncbi:Crp/Fnr family transcriptional regulator [Formosa sp. 3Alg 14/1]|uniref:Crp/Fnr family transcriptional regulator n=1 Tax=Formosa sp. 3Alg 14/1 TaxID=3382190 RepID=UPI0039BE60CD
MHKTPSNENLHCITDCELLRIKRDDVDVTAKLGVTQMQYTIQVLQQQLEKNKQRAIDHTTLSAEQRYVKLQKEHPTIIQNIPLKYIASYLGINPGSLSRIRNELNH